MQTLREILGKPVLFHRVGWHGKSAPNLAGYDSRNPTVIAHQLQAMVDLGGEGAGGNPAFLWVQQPVYRGICARNLQSMQCVGDAVRAVYGSLVGEGREREPAGVSCERSSHDRSACEYRHAIHAQLGHL
jgi:hypothetical protein